MHRHFLNQVCPRLCPLSSYLPENIKKDPELDQWLIQILIDRPDEPLPELRDPQNNLNDVKSVLFILLDHLHGNFKNFEFFQNDPCHYSRISNGTPDALFLCFRGLNPPEHLFQNRECIILKVCFPIPC
jgi:hypothetical protein